MGKRKQKKVTKPVTKRTANMKARKPLNWKFEGPEQKVPMSKEKNSALEDGVPDLSSENKLADTGQLDEHGNSTPKIELFYVEWASRRIATALEYNILSTDKLLCTLHLL